jgi:hypothetical protein
MPTSSSITVAGMISGHRELTIDPLIDHARVDADGRCVVSMIDLLALLRLHVDAELLLVEFVNGASRAIRISEIVERDAIGIELRVRTRPGCSGAVWSAHLRSSDSASASAIASIRALSFAAFVGSP